MFKKKGNEVQKEIRTKSIKKRFYKRKSFWIGIIILIILASAMMKDDEFIKQYWSEDKTSLINNTDSDINGESE